MGYQSQYIDLRVLFVQQEEATQSLQQVAMDGFQFDRIAYASDQQNALDQLCFSNFDLIILGNNLSPETVEKLVEGCQATAQEPILPILVLGDAKTISQNIQKQSHLLFCQAQSSMRQLSNDLGRIFRQAQAFRDKGPDLHSRTTHSAEEHAGQ